MFLFGQTNIVGLRTLCPKRLPDGFNGPRDGRLVVVAGVIFLPNIYYSPRQELREKKRAFDEV